MGGDLGGDAGQSALGLSAKVIEALLRLLDKLYQSYLDRGKRELTQEQLSALKDDAERKQVLENLNGKTGIVNYAELKKSGVPLSSFGVYMTEQEMKAFAAQCKREGILFSGMTDSTKTSQKGEVQYEICCKSEDLPAMKKVIERMEQEIRLVNLNRAEEQLLAKGEENLSDADREQLQNIRAEREVIQRGFCRDMNAQTSESVIDSAVHGVAREPLTLAQALNHYTGGELDKRKAMEFSIVADAQDPTKYIKCHGEDDTFRGESYIKTTYEVHHGDDVLMTTHDGRFEGRPQGYWQQQKDAMQEAGQFSGTFFKFYTMDEYKEWTQSVAKQNEQELSGMTQETKDYSTIISSLEAELDKKGCKMQDGVVCDKETGEPISLADDMSEERKADVAELVVIGKQIENYKSMQELEVLVSVAQTNLITEEQGTSEYEVAKSNLESVQGRFEEAKATESQLVEQRMEINAVQSKLEVRRDTAELMYLPEDKDKIEALEAKIEDYIKNPRAVMNAALRSDGSVDGVIEKVDVDKLKAELVSLKAEAVVKAQNAANAEKQDERREERVAEKDEKQMSMEEVKGQIAERRANEGVKTNDTKDRQVQEHGAQAAVSKTSKPHER